MGVSIIRTIVFGGLYWGPIILGNYRICFMIGVQVFWDVVTWKMHTESSGLGMGCAAVCATVHRNLWNVALMTP